MILLGIIVYSNNLFGINQDIAYLNRQKMDDVNIEISTQKLSQIKVKTTLGANIGSIAIPKLGILLPISNEPYSSSALKNGAQQMATNDGNWKTLGTGNFILVGHNYANGYQYFSALQENVDSNYPYLQKNKCVDNEWLNGQQVYIANSNFVYDFQIDKQYLISKNDKNVLNDTPASEINLITCLEPDDSYRIVTHGVLKKKWRWRNAPVKVASYFDLSRYSFNNH